VLARWETPTPDQPGYRDLTPDRIDQMVEDAEGQNPP
jgi:hypothetical protein